MFAKKWFFLKHRKLITAISSLIVIALIAITVNLRKTKTYVIWQVPTEIAYETDWLKEVFSGLNYEEIEDTKFEIYKDNAIVVVSTDKDVEKNTYFSNLSQKNFKYGVVVLSDEFYSSSTEFYGTAKFVLRNYWHKKFSDQKNILFFPLGYKKGFWGGNENLKPKQAHERKYIWSFAGQIQKSSRVFMINNMKKVPDFRIHETFKWEDPNALSVTDYRNILLESVFVPCPRGWWNLDSFRLYEALECGCIPIVEKTPFDYFQKMFGSYPFLSVNSWDEAPELINNYLSDPAALEELRMECFSWWNNYKKGMQRSVSDVIHEKFEKQI